MIVYNETIIVDESVHQQWLSWMKAEYIPQVMQTGHFKSHNILTVLNSPNEGVTYCIQYLTDSIDNYNNFSHDVLPHLHSLQMQRFENKFVLFNTLMKTVN